MDEVREKIVEALRRGGAEDADVRAVRNEVRGNIVQVMRRKGISPAKALAAACRGAQIPPAKSEWLRRPLKAKSHGVAAESCWKLLAAPVSRVDGKLCIAFADPQVAKTATIWGLPEHTAHLALEEHIRAVLQATLGRPSTSKHAPIKDKSEDESTLPLQETELISPSRLVPQPVDQLFAEKKAQALEVTAPKQNPPIVRNDREVLVDERTSEIRLSVSELESFKDPGETEMAPRPKRGGGTKINIGTGNVSVLDGGPIIDDPIKDKAVIDALYSGTLDAEAHGFEEGATIAGFEEGATEALEVPSQFQQELAAKIKAQREPAKLETTNTEAAQPLRKNESAEITAADAPLEQLIPPAFPVEPPAALNEPTDADTLMPAIGSITRYRPLREIGRGGMAAVYLAEREATRERVALKVMDPYLARDEQFIERFRREASSMISLAHNNIVRVLDPSFEEGGTYYIATEYVDGGTLRDLLNNLEAAKTLSTDTRSLAPVALVVEFLDQALAGLEHAHQHKLVHRDLKPVNFMLTREGVLKLCDFGIAKDLGRSELTKAGVLFGTPQYMSPEQIDESPLDGRSDLFSLGTLCLEMLSGVNPFDDTVLHRQLARVQQAVVPSAFEMCPNIVPLLDTILQRLMQRKRDDRYRSATEVREVLRPLSEAVRGRHGNVLHQAVQNPSSTREALLSDESLLHASAASVALAKGAQREAGFRFYCAAFANPSSASATSELAQIRRTQGFRFDGVKDDFDLLDLKKSHVKKGMNVCEASRDLLGKAIWARRGLQVFPERKEYRTTFARITGANALTPYNEVPLDPSKTMEVSLSDLERSVGVSSNSWLLPFAGIGILFCALGILIAFFFTRTQTSLENQNEENVAVEETLVDENTKAMAEGERLFARGQLDKAEAAFTRALKSMPKQDDRAIDAFLLRGRVRKELNNARDARLDLREVLQRTESTDPRHRSAKNEMATLSN